MYKQTEETGKVIDKLNNTLAEIDVLKEQKTKLLNFLEEFASCEPSWSDDRMDYEEIQIDKKTKLEAQKLIKQLKERSNAPLS